MELWSLRLQKRKDYLCFRGYSETRLQGKLLEVQNSIFSFSAPLPYLNYLINFTFIYFFKNNLPFFSFQGGSLELHLEIYFLYIYFITYLGHIWWRGVSGLGHLLYTKSPFMFMPNQFYTKLFISFAWPMEICMLKTKLSIEEMKKIPRRLHGLWELANKNLQMSFFLFLSPLPLSSPTF